MDRDNSGARDFGDFDKSSTNYSSDDNDDISTFREQRRRKFDIRAAKRAKSGRNESRKKERSFTRVSKEDRYS